MQAAIKLGTRFYRVAAAGVPPAAAAFEPHPRKGKEDCVTCCDPCGCPHKALVDEYYFWLVDGAYYQPPQTPVPTSYQVPPTDTDQDYQEGYQNDFYDPSQQEAVLWQDTSQSPKLLYWQASPLVRLAWCRVRDGAFQEPRQSDLGVAITTGRKAISPFSGGTPIRCISPSATRSRRTATPTRRRPASATIWRRTRRRRCRYPFRPRRRRASPPHCLPIPTSSTTHPARICSRFRRSVRRSRSRVPSRRIAGSRRCSIGIASPSIRCTGIAPGSNATRSHPQPSAEPAGERQGRDLPQPVEWERRRARA